MSEEKTSYLAVGVFKVDSMSAGFPQLKEIALEWAKDESFYELIVRQVSESNFGIQFVYFKSDSEDKKKYIIKYKNELSEKFGSGFYAWDLMESSGVSALEKAKQMVVVSKSLELN